MHFENLAANVARFQPFKSQPHRMVKHTQTICRLLPTNCLSVFEHFEGLALKRLKCVWPFCEVRTIFWPFWKIDLDSMCLFQMKTKNSRLMTWLCSRLIINTTGRHEHFFVSFEHILEINVLIFALKISSVAWKHTADIF